MNMEELKAAHGESEVRIQNLQSKLNTLVASIKDAFRWVDDSGDYISFRGRIQKAVLEASIDYRPVLPTFPEEKPVVKSKAEQDLDRAFYDLVVKERNSAWRDIEDLRNSNKALKMHLEASEENRALVLSNLQAAVKRVTSLESRTRDLEKMLKESTDFAESLRKDIGEKSSEYGVAYRLNAEENGRLKCQIYGPVGTAERNVLTALKDVPVFVWEEDVKCHHPGAPGYGLREFGKAVLDLISVWAEEAKKKG